MTKKCANLLTTHHLTTWCNLKQPETTWITWDHPGQRLRVNIRMCFPFPDRLICCFCTDSRSTFAGAALAAFATIPVMLVNLAILGNLQNQPSSPPTSNSTAECCQELLWCNWCMHMYNVHVFIIWQLRLWVILMIMMYFTGCSVEAAAHCQELLLRQNLSRFFRESVQIY